MSIGSRIKELRIKRGITQEELAKKIGVTKGAVANYENEISSPKIDLMYKLFDALDCDANYLHQDDMKKTTYKNVATPEEFEQIIKKYRALDPHGKEMVDFTLSKEWERSTVEANNVVKFKSVDKSHLTPNAAHDRTDIEFSEQDRQDDEDMLD